MALAQEGQVQKDSAGLTEIVVTAEKRKENIKDVPISITAVSGDQLKAEHTTDMTDLARSLPDVSFSGASGSGAGAGLNNIEIRGVSSQAGQSTVGLYLDDVSLTTPNTGTLGAPEPKFFDIDRIEVLRGPQGTLYGAGSEGGTIRFVSKQPDLDDYSGSVSTDLSGTDGGGFNNTETAVVNIPIIPDELAVRAGIQVGRKDGYIDQVSPYTGDVVKSDINGEDDQVAKVTVKWKATDALTLEPALLYQRVRSDDSDIQYLD